MFYEFKREDVGWTDCDIIVRALRDFAVTNLLEGFGMQLKFVHIEGTYNIEKFVVALRVEISLKHLTSSQLRQLEAGLDQCRSFAVIDLPSRVMVCGAPGLTQLDPLNLAMDKIGDSVIEATSVLLDLRDNPPT